MRDSEISRRGLERRWLSDLRESIDPSFLEGIERMREQLFGTTLASMFYKLLGKYIFHGGCVPADADARVAVEAPDCNFDKSFGYPCSEKQLQRVEKAAGKKKALTKY